MIKVDNKIKNIYYMLCYTFRESKLNIKDEAKLGEEAFENIYELFATLLCIMLRGLLRQGMYKGYNYEQEELQRVRGKINIIHSINNCSIQKNRFVCDFDEFSSNVIINKIIKTTLNYLIKSQKITSDTKDIVRRILLYYKDIDELKTISINWNTITFTRNNNAYRNCITLCRFILKGLIVSDKNGNNVFKEFLDDTTASTIYEAFIRKYYNTHYPMLNASSRILNFNTSSSSGLWPIMKTDITLEYGEKTLVIDAKFYSRILSQNRFNTKTIISNNLYQILAYVDNIDPYKKNKAIGMLLYAQTADGQNIHHSDVANEHRIEINTLNMNEDWETIKKTLNEIAEDFMNGFLI